MHEEKWRSILENESCDTPDSYLGKLVVGALDAELEDRFEEAWLAAWRWACDPEDEELKHRLVTLSLRAKERATLIRPPGPFTYKAPPSGEDELYLAVEHDDPIWVRERLALGDDPNRPNSYGCISYLHHAVDTQTDQQVECPVNTSVIRMLLDAGADPTVQHQHGRTPIEWARGYPEIEALFKGTH